MKKTTGFTAPTKTQPILGDQFAKLSFHDAMFVFNEIKKVMAQKTKDEWARIDKESCILKEFTSQHQI